MKRSFLRLAPFALMAVALASCDARRLTSNDTGDTSPPFIDVGIPGDTTQPVDIGLPLAVGVTAADNLSLLRIEVTVTAGGSLIARDTVRFNTQTPTYSNTFPVSLIGVGAGTVVVIRGVALDGAGNIGFDSMVVAVADTSAPRVQITSPATDQEFKAGNQIRITLKANDNAGIDRLGYEIQQFGPAGDTTMFFRDSVIYPVGNKPIAKDTTFLFTVPGGMPAAAFGVRGFAHDVSGNRGFSNYVPFLVRDTVPPTITFLAPPESARFSPADSFVVTVRLQDSVGLQRLSLVGIATRGDPAFGIVDTVIRYDSTFAPINVSGEPRSFPPGTTDVTVSRYMKPVDRNDTITEPIKIVARVTDVSNNVTTAIRTVILVSGPRIFINRPGAGSQTSAGKSIIVELRATDRDGVTQIGYTINEIGVNRFRNISNNPTDTTWIDTVTVPATTPAGTRLTIQPYAFDRGGQPGSSGSIQVVVLAPALDVTGPLVYQTIQDRLEIDDTVTVRAIDASGVLSVGYRVQDSLNVTVDSQLVTVSGNASDEVIDFQLRVPPSYQGSRLKVTSFAFDTRGNVGYSVPAGDTVPRTSMAASAVDTLDVVYGRTYPLPSGGFAADIAVDTVTGRQRAYVSNITNDRLEVWESTTNAFNSRFVAVGADPWGMFVDADTLLVANSAGTNISRVYIGSPTVTGVNEILGRRIKTPLSIAFDINIFFDEAGRHFAIVAYQFSDRPQYVAQMRRSGPKGDIFYSTKPTISAPEGTIRRYDPEFNESQQVWQYGRKRNAPTGSVAVFNVDSAFAIVGGDSLGDLLVLCDHPYGDQNPASAYCVSGSNVLDIIYGDTLGNPYLRDAVHRSDAVGISELIIPTLALTDTTFVATGGDRRWVAFGEADTEEGTPGRVMMAKDTLVYDTLTSSFINFFSHSLFVSDLTNNAAERVTGLAINKNSSIIGVHGTDSFFSEVNHPFLLRLQGKVSTFSDGAGIAFHPQNTGNPATDGQPENTAFVASSNGTIEIMDTHHYLKRGELPVRSNLYGPIRVTERFANDDPNGDCAAARPTCVILKLFGLTVDGFIVIDIRAQDIKPLP